MNTWRLAAMLLPAGYFLLFAAVVWPFHWRERGRKMANITADTIVASILFAGFYWAMRGLGSLDGPIWIILTGLTLIVVTFGVVSASFARDGRPVTAFVSAAPAVGALAGICAAWA